MEELTVKKVFAVIGLGQFGGSICKELIELGCEVLAIDKDEDVIDEYAEIVTHAVVGDAVDEHVLKDLGIWNFDHVVVAIGNDLQASILVSLMLKEMGVKQVTAKALSENHEKVLKKIGVDHVVRPEQDMGRRLARNLVQTNVLDYLELSDEFSIVEMQVNGAIAGRSIIDLDIRARYGINIVAIKRQGSIIVSPGATEVFEEEDIIICIGAVDDLARFERRMFK